jgi:hypothetical protein
MSVPSTDPSSQFPLMSDAEIDAVINFLNQLDTANLSISF